jgi:DNA-binding response OmpR family regulator
MGATFVPCAGKPLPALPAPKKVLVVHPADGERFRLINILRGCVCEVDCQTELAADLAALDDVRVVLCGGGLPDGAWRNLLTRVGVTADPPLVIITSRLADDQLWVEALNLGAFDLLAEPFCEEEVVRVVDQWLSKHGMVTNGIKALMR